MADLPVVPFEKLLSYLNLEDVLKSRAVCRSWCQMIDNYKVKTLCYSKSLSGFIYGKDRLVSDAQNVVVCTRPSFRSRECKFTN